MPPLARNTDTADHPPLRSTGYRTPDASVDGPDISGRPSTYVSFNRRATNRFLEADSAALA